MHITSEKELIFVFAVALCMVLFLIGYIIYFVYLYQRRKLSSHHEKQQLENHFHQELLRTQLEIQEQTFKHISQEIHDNIGQILSLARLHVKTMNPGDLKTLMEKAKSSDHLIGKAIQDLRDLSRSLNTTFITDAGLPKAIAYELEQLKKATACQTELQIEGDTYLLSPQQELILFRIFQEALNNIIKHAKAGVISVGLQYSSTHFLLHIKDDGQGFEAARQEPAHAAAGMGLRNMRSRAQLIGAGFLLESTPGRGTVIAVSLAV